MISSWLELTSNLISPIPFKTMAFYTMIGACMERRVWIGSIDWMPLFPNLYTIMVGPPASGKSLTLKAAYSVLSEVTDGDEERFPVAPDATTFRALLDTINGNSRAIKNGEGDRYEYMSTLFLLEEISSLFRRNEEDVSRLLLQTYDANKKYEYSTSTRGHIRLRNTCVSILGCTTKDFLDLCFSDQVLLEGFASRTIFVFADSPAFRTSIIPPLNVSQLEHKIKIQHHIAKLGNLYGPVDSSAIDALVEEWWQDEASVTTNTHPKLAHYYGRKNIHIKKLAMCIHFSKSVEMKIGAECFGEALAVLDSVETTMHEAISMGGKNELAPEARQIHSWIRSNPGTSYTDILLNFYDSNPKGEQGIQEILQALLNMKKIKETITKAGRTFLPK